MSSSSTAAAAGATPRDPRTSTVLYKILTPSEHASLPSGTGEEWRGTSLDLSDGFIHLSTSDQLPGTLERFFAKGSGIGDELWIMAIPRTKIDPDTFRFDQVSVGLFGHVYGPITPSKDFTLARKVHRTGPNETFELGELEF